MAGKDTYSLLVMMKAACEFDGTVGVQSFSVSGEQVIVNTKSSQKLGAVLSMYGLKSAVNGAHQVVIDKAQLGDFLGVLKERAVQPSAAFQNNLAEIKKDMGIDPTTTTELSRRSARMHGRPVNIHVTPYTPAPWITGKLSFGAPSP